MDLDSFQKAWQSQASQTRVTVDADLLRKEVQRSQQNFRSTIIARDLREILVGLVMLPFWFYLGHKWSLPWTWWLGIPAITWVCLFIVVDRIWNKQRPSEPGEPLLDCVNASLTQVSHQIWMLRNVFWWYLLPFAIAMMAFFAQTSWNLSASYWTFALRTAGWGFFLLLIYGFGYWLNQRAVRKSLVPRREELLSLQASIGDEGAGGNAQATDIDEIRSPGVVRQALFVTALSAALVGLMFLADGLFQSQVVPMLKHSDGAPASFAKLVTDQREEKRLVGLGAVVTVDGKVVAWGVNGERKWPSGVLIERGDEWHLGGITSSITATMIARLIESGQLQWTTTIGECFPDAEMDEGWKPITFEDLLTRTSGAPDMFPEEMYAQKPPLGPESTNARLEAVLQLLATKPENPAGKKYVYSHCDYAIAAAMVEKKTGSRWEELVKREVFEPLGLASAGFGPPKSPDDTLPQPVGHRPYLGGKIPASDTADNTTVIAPGGGVHMTLADLATYANDQMAGEAGKGKLFSAETYRRLLMPRLEKFACGWVKMALSNDIPFTVYWNNGSNTMWYALVAIIPEKNMVVAVASNDGDVTSGGAAAWEIVKAAVKEGISKP